MEPSRAQTEKSKGGRPPGRQNNRTIALGAQLENLLPSKDCLQVLRIAVKRALAKKATSEDVKNGVAASLKGLSWHGFDALARQPLPPPQDHVIRFHFEGDEPPAPGRTARARKRKPKAKVRVEARTEPGGAAE